MTEGILQVNHLSKSFGKNLVLKDIDFTVNTGDVISIRFGEHTGHYQVTAVADTVSKDHASEMYKVLDEDSFLSLERNKT